MHEERLTPVLTQCFFNKPNQTDLHCYTFESVKMALTCEPVKMAHMCEQSFNVYWIPVLILRQSKHG
jgi:hypothetical protein